MSMQRDDLHTGRPTATAEPAATTTVVGFHEEIDVSRRDRIRWGPVWAGLTVVPSTYLLLQLALIAVGVVELGGDTTTDVVSSAVAATVAFFLGGVTAGATAMWRGVDDGLLHGVVLWGVGLIALLVLSVAGSGLALDPSTPPRCSISSPQTRSTPCRPTTPRRRPPVRPSPAWWSRSPPAPPVVSWSQAWPRRGSTFAIAGS